MSGMETHLVLAKKKLTNPVMWTDRAYSGLSRIYETFLWKIDDFYIKKDGVVHMGPALEKGLRMSFVKKRYALTVTLFTSDDRCYFNCCILFDDSRRSNCRMNSYSVILESKKVSDGAYEVHFPPAAVKDKSNHFLTSGELILVFKVGPPTKMEMLPRSYRSETKFKEKAAVATALSEIGVNSVGMDFVIVVEEKKYRLNKGLLAARSGFFRSHFDCDPNVSEMKLDITRPLFAYVVDYIHSGQMTRTKEADSSQLLELASKLQMNGLIALCSIRLINTMDSSNVQQIRQLGVKYNVNILVTAAKNFIKRK